MHATLNFFSLSHPTITLQNVQNLALSLSSWVEESRMDFPAQRGGRGGGGGGLSESLTLKSLTRKNVPPERPLPPVGFSTPLPPARASSPGGSEPEEGGRSAPPFETGTQPHTGGLGRVNFRKKPFRLYTSPTQQGIRYL